MFLSSIQCEKLHFEMRVSNNEPNPLTPAPNKISPGQNPIPPAPPPPPPPPRTNPVCKGGHKFPLPFSYLDKMPPPPFFIL